MATTVNLYTPGRVLTAGDGITVRRINFGFGGPRELSFGRDVRFDEDDVFNNGDKISVTIDGTTVFTGWLLDHDPRLDRAESIEYRAVGPRYKLSLRTHVRNDSGRVIYNAEDREQGRGSTTNWTYGSIFEDIVKRIPNNIIASYTGHEAMDTQAPETSFIGMSVDECLRYIVEKAGTFGFYITPQREVRVVNLADTTGKKVYVGQIGQTLANHPEYDVARANLNWSVSNCKTKCTIEGSRRRREKWIRLTPDWPPLMERYWNTSVFVGGVPDNMPPGNPRDAFTKYTFSDKGTLERIRGDLISDHKGATTEWFNDADEWFPLQASIDMANGIARFPGAIYNLRIKGSGTNSRSVVYTAAKAKMLCVLEGDPIKVTVGPIGTAADRGVDAEIYIVDSSLVRENVARPGTSAIRNDLSKMTTLAQQVLAPLKDEQITGTVTLDDIDFGWTLEHNMNMENTNEGKWSNIDASILEITYNLEGTQTTIVRVSNSQYLGAGLDYAELKRRMMTGQNIRRLKAKVDDLTRRTTSILGSTGSNTGGIQASGDALGEPGGGGSSSANIKEVVQQAMNDNYFTIQRHDHTGSEQGGDAFASKGSALL